MISTTPICLLIIVLLLTLNTADDSGGVCQEFDCSSPVRLCNLVDQVLGEDNIFMINNFKEPASHHEKIYLTMKKSRPFLFFILTPPSS